MKNMMWKSVMCLPLLFLLGCESNSVKKYSSFSVDENDTFGDNAREIHYLDQGWSRADSEWFYNTTQGSDLISYWVYLGLEDENSSAENIALLRSDKNTKRFRYIPQSTSKLNPDGLPLGFVKDTYRGQDYIGYTCAACHTSQLNYKGVGFVIDGGPAMADMELFLVSLEKSLKKTIDQAARMQRLAERVKKPLEEVAIQVKKDYDSIQNYNELNHSKNDGKDIDYGYARLDAFGRIFNRVLAHLTPEIETTINSPNAPVSYPFLWDTPYHDFVQWNGIGDNGGATAGFRLGPLGRNVGEVLGVFGELSLEPGKDQFVSSANKLNLEKLERKLQSLWSPSWDNAAEKSSLPKIDKALAKKGEQVYRDYQCGACHQHLGPEERKSIQRRVIAQFTSPEFLETDTQMIDNAATYCGEAGYFINDGVGMCNSDPKKVPAIGALSKAASSVIIKGDPEESFFRRTIDVLKLLLSSSKQNPIKDTTRHIDLEEGNRSNLMGYKGRPLNGVWATAPYLHNGSVPNLYELFLPACEHIGSVKAVPSRNCRSTTFTIGSRELDAEKVGFVSKPQSDYPDLFVFDTTLPGNRNTGHEYAAGVTPMIMYEGGKVVRDAQGNIGKRWFDPITEEKRRALVEYVKSL